MIRPRTRDIALRAVVGLTLVFGYLAHTHGWWLP